MPITHPRLPPFGALLAFEGVARLGSFTAAARELKVSQAAVSQKVRELEAWLGCELVLRSRPLPVITGEGRELAEAIRAGIDTIARPLDLLRRAGRQSNQVTLAATNAFALYWLGPRIKGFYADHPEVEFNLITTDAEVTEGSFDFDLGITFASRRPDRYACRGLFSTETIAVAAPSYLATRPAGLEPAQWRGDTLLHLAKEAWMDWPEWLNRVGLPAPADRRVGRYSTFITLIQAVIAGRGIGLGWRQLVDPLLESGEVVQIGGRSAMPAGAYYLISKAAMDAPAPYGVASLRNWLLGYAEI